MTDENKREAGLLQAFEKYKAEWSDVDCPLSQIEVSAYKAGYRDALAAWTKAQSGNKGKDNG